MSDLMLLGVLRMPMDDPSPLEVAQYVARGRQAADEIERLTTERERDRAREYHAAELADVVAEADQLRQYLDTAQRRASALGDEVAGLREDAERWRHIRDKSAWTATSANGLTRIAIRLPVDMPIEADDELDAAVDAARKGTT